ncbi:MAG TPA: helix-turn-helix domain-containing protein [Phototrophicaceae bacterium]|jgi:excisionase family DNA binding protein|nr:helix-turn-helix domain-containing protein [Phototrophicaceae bacterium]
MNDHSEWVSLRRAADMLGVHPATVRNWADEGKLPSRRTPGNHRRFKVSDLHKYAQSEPETQAVEVQVIIQNALGQTRMNVGDGTLDKVPWYEAMSEATRQNLRAQGREVLEEIRKYLAGGAQDSGLSVAIKLGERYAVQLSSDHLTLPQAVRGFFYFSDFVINSILTWSEITPHSASEWATLLRHVNTFINAMLLSLIEYYESE